MPSSSTVWSLILLWGSLSAAWNVAGGYAGQVSIGHAAFFGIGAYSAALMVTRFGRNPWLGMLLGIALVAGGRAGHRLSLQSPEGPVLRPVHHRFLTGPAHRGEPVARLHGRRRGHTGSLPPRVRHPRLGPRGLGVYGAWVWLSSTTSSRSTSNAHGWVSSWPECERTRTPPRRSASPLVA